MNKFTFNHKKILLLNGYKKIILILQLFCIILFGCTRENYSIGEYDISLLNEYNIIYNLNDEYKEYYRLYCFIGKRNSYILTIYNENNIWYLSYDWHEINDFLFIDDMEIELHNLLYLMKKDDIEKFNKIIKKLGKIKNYGNNSTGYIENTYYLKYNSNIIKNIDHANKSRTGFNEIIIFYNNLLEKYKDTNNEI